MPSNVPISPILNMPAAAKTAGEYAAEGVTTFWIFDLDGVIIPDSYGTHPKGYFGVSRGADGRYPNKYYEPLAHRGLRQTKSFYIKWSVELISKLSQAFTTPNSQVVFVTTWREDMGGIVKMIDLKTSRPPVYLPWGEDCRGEPHEPKVDAVDVFLNSNPLPEGLKLVWAEDKAINKVTAEDSIFRQFDSSNIHLFKPVEKYGLSIEEADAILNISAL